MKTLQTHQENGQQQRGLIMTIFQKAFTIITTTFLLAACSNPYVISTKEGRMIPTDDEPEYDALTDTYQYEDADGNKQAIKKDDVIQIIER
jgi:hypothetical protein